MWTATLPKSSAGGAIAPPVSMNLAEIAVSWVALPATSVVQVSTSAIVVADDCRCGVTATVAIPPGIRASGYVVGEISDISNGDDVASDGANSVIVAVP